MWVDETTAAALAADLGDGGAVTGRPIDATDDCDLVVSIGGDGTFLGAARSAGATPTVGVNLGDVGVLNPVAPEDAVDTVEEVVARLRETGEVATQELPRVRARGEEWSLGPPLEFFTALGKLD